MFRLIIAGSRSLLVPPSNMHPAQIKFFTQERTKFLSSLIESATSKHFADVTEVVSGGSTIDRLGEQWARKHGIPFRRFEPNWSIGRGAGHTRNRQMGNYAFPNGGLLALWDGESRGTEGMFQYAMRLDLDTWIYVLKGELVERVSGRYYNNGNCVVEEKIG